MEKKICENSLRWLLNLRKHGTNFVVCQDGADSGGSIRWVKDQSKYVDIHGLSKWLHSNRSIGYSHYLQNVFQQNKFKQGTLSDFYKFYTLGHEYNGETYEQFLEFLLKNSRYHAIIDRDGNVDMEKFLAPMPLKI